MLGENIATISSYTSGSTVNIVAGHIVHSHSQGQCHHDVRNASVHTELGVLIG